MTLHCYHFPFLFHEAAELLFLYTNGLPMPDLAQEKSRYSIPGQELERMMTEACQDISWENETLQTFFRQYKLPKSAAGAFTCLARILAFSFADLSCQTAEQSVASIVRRLEEVRDSDVVFDDLRPFTVDTYPGESEDAGISALSAPAGLRLAFAQVYSDPAGTLQPLVELIAPVMTYLQQALRPWAFRAEPMLQIWEDTMRSQTPEQFFSESLHYSEVPPVTRIEMGLMYFLPQWLTCGLENNGNLLKIFIGAGTTLLTDKPINGLMSWEYRALHLMSSPVRVRMLNALREKPMSSRELSQELGIHLGTVTRDINNMDEAYLLNIVPIGPRRRYSLNRRAIRTLAQHLIDMFDDDEPAN